MLIGAGSSNGVDAISRFNPDLVSARLAHAVRAKHGIPTDAALVGFVGRLTRDKGIVELLEAWRTVRSINPTAHLLVVGAEDSACPDTVNAIAGLRSDPRVHLHGSDRDTPPIYAALDLLVLPTYREGFPNVLLEAGAMRVPVVATMVAGCVDAVEHERTGLLVPARDSHSLAAAISRYVSDKQLGVRHGRAARERILRLFDQQVIWNGLAELYGAGISTGERIATSSDERSKERAA
jgi:glycosyltransferase involved in cell wall biosynthesis